MGNAPPAADQRDESERQAFDNAALARAYKVDIGRALEADDEKGEVVAVDHELGAVGDIVTDAFSGETFDADDFPTGRF